MGSSHSHHDQDLEEHERHIRETEERARLEAEEARRREVESREQEAQRRGDDTRERAEEMHRYANEARQREEEARRAAEEARRVFEETRRRDEELRQREEAGHREEIARQLAEASERAAWEAQQREAQAKACEEEGERQEEKAADKAREEAERVNKDLVQANFCVFGGIQPVVWPTEEEFKLAYSRIQYNPEKMHFAICGSSGTGKSSLINAFRGLANRDAGAAPAGVYEATNAITRYPDPRAEFPYSHFVWFDTPGARALDIPGWQYFNKEGLFIFDVIVLVYDTRLTQIDVAIIQNCEQYRIPLYVVRSKADVHIKNILEDMKPDSDEGDRPNDDELYKQARQIFIQSTRGNFEQNLQKAELTKRDVFIVSSGVIRALVAKRCNSRVSKMMVDEAKLLEAVLKETYVRLRKTQLSLGNTSL